MTLKKMFLSVLFFGILFIYLMGDVPLPKTLGPEIPGFLQPMNFMSLKLRMFPQPVAGMIPDVFGDMTWNPAYINDYQKPLIYFDWNSPQESSVFPYSPSNNPWSYYSYHNLSVPGWYYRSPRSLLDVSPLYNLAAVLPLGRKWILGFSGRTVFDQGSWFSTLYNADEMSNNHSRGFTGWGTSSSGDLKALETGENQQDVLGHQMEITLGFKPGETFMVAMKAGYYRYGREGNVYTNEWEKNPRNESAFVHQGTRDESFDQWNVGLGLLFNISKKTRLGLSAGYVRGEGSEEVDVFSGNDYLYECWWNPEYKGEWQYGNQLNENNTFEGNGTRLAITLDHQFSDKLSMRSFLSLDESNRQTVSTVKNSYHYMRRYSYYNWEYNRKFELEGDFEQPERSWRWMNSIFYSLTENSWFFAGIQMQGRGYTEKVDENADSSVVDWDDYDYCTYRSESRYKSDYQFERNTRYLMIHVPMGISIEVVKNFNIVVGANYTMNLSSTDIAGRLFYPEKTFRTWDDDVLDENDDETNRLEKYSDMPPKKFDRTWSHSFGLIYRLSSVFRFYFSSKNDVWDTGNWALGVDVTF